MSENKSRSLSQRRTVYVAYKVQDGQPKIRNNVNWYARGSRKNLLESRAEQDSIDHYFDRETSSQLRPLWSRIGKFA